MNAAAQIDLRSFAATKWPALNHKGRLRELARLLPVWTARRVRSVYNGEFGVALRADERADIEAITGEADAVRRSQEAYRDLEARIASLEAIYAQLNAQPRGEQLAAPRGGSREHVTGAAPGGRGNGPAHNQ